MIQIELLCPRVNAPRTYPRSLGYITVWMMNSRVVCRDSDNGVVPRERWALALVCVFRRYSAVSGGGAGRRKAFQRYNSELIKTRIFKMWARFIFIDVYDMLNIILNAIKIGRAKKHLIARRKNNIQPRLKPRIFPNLLPSKLAMSFLFQNAFDHLDHRRCGDCMCSCSFWMVEGTAVSSFRVMQA